MPQSPTKTGTPRLSDVARHLVLPTGITSTGWPAVRAQCLDLGIRFDPWQEGLGRAILAKRNGTYAAGIGGVVMSIPRQIGKTFTVGGILFALCIRCPGMTVLWTAQRADTAAETFHSMQGMAKRQKIKPFIDQVFLGSGDEEVRFRNGSRILFGARERGFGRGQSSIDVEVFDEAQILSNKALADMVPATNQSRQPAGALLFFMGTPPKPGDACEVFTTKRTKALAGLSTDTLYLEISADSDADPDDRRQWVKANPSYPKRTPVASMLRMQENLTVEDFIREGLGVWDEDAAAVPPKKWAQGADPDSKIVGKAVLAVSMTPDRAFVALAAAGIRADGHLHVEIVLEGPAEGRFGDKNLSFTAESAAIAVRQGSKVIVCPSHPAGGLVPALEKGKAQVEKMPATVYTQSCGAFYDAVKYERLHYKPPQPELDAAIDRAGRRKAGESWRWSGENISALVAASQAVYAAMQAPVGGKGRVVLLAQ